MSLRQEGWGVPFYTLWFPTGISDGLALPAALGLPVLEVRREPPPAFAPLSEGKARGSRCKAFLCTASGCPP